MKSFIPLPANIERECETNFFFSLRLCNQPRFCISPGFRLVLSNPGAVDPSQRTVLCLLVDPQRPKYMTFIAPSSVPCALPPTTGRNRPINPQKTRRKIPHPPGGHVHVEVSPHASFDHRSQLDIGILPKLPVYIRIGMLAVRFRFPDSRIKSLSVTDPSCPACHPVLWLCRR